MSVSAIVSSPVLLRPGRWLALALAVCAAPVALAAAVGSGWAMTGAALGSAAAAAGVTVALLTLSRSSPDARGALKAISWSMLTRMALLGAAAAVAVRLPGALWWCLGSFFAGFVASQAIEAAYVARQGRSRG